MNDAVKGIYISIVDIIGIFIPGFVFIVGLFSLTHQCSPEFFNYFNEGSSNKYEWISEPLSLGIVFIFSYVLGFLLRLGSIRLLQNILHYQNGI
ncbi:MAG: hypothetical protein A2V93_06655 [Ignavibacteria bacterium RBG_16_34_14]|nr:MAG: hypothetical protein A2V93_06655 [Ignavibacteria bacterium RBG_16_34_14]